MLTTKLVNCAAKHLRRGDVVILEDPVQMGMLIKVTRTKWGISAIAVMPDSQKYDDEEDTLCDLGWNPDDLVPTVILTKTDQS